MSFIVPQCFEGEAHDRIRQQGQHHSIAVAGSMAKPDRRQRRQHERVDRTVDLSRVQREGMDGSLFEKTAIEQGVVGR